jgi:hypothetical protein
MTILLRIILTVAGTLAGTILWTGGGRFVGPHTVDVVLFWTLPLLAFTTLVLWPAELVLTRLGCQAAIIIVAPLLGLVLPYAQLLVAQHRDGAMHAIAFVRWTVLACGIAWAISLIVCTLCRPRLQTS